MVHESEPRRIIPNKALVVVIVGNRASRKSVGIAHVKPP
jgi:hypothetical protein